MDVLFEQKRKSLRLPHYDYSQPGYYFVTICVQDMKQLFGRIENNEMLLNNVGKMIDKWWQWLASHHDYISLDEYQIMPNHFHGIVCINNIRSGGSRTATTCRSKTLGRLIGAFKTVSTKHINILCSTPSKHLWQRSFYDRVIRNEKDLSRIREYIQNNPLNWEKDEYYADTAC